MWLIGCNGPVNALSQPVRLALAEGVREGHASAVLAASIFHFGTFTIPETKRFLARRGLPMRI